ncbi:hypothetical protein CYMTET_40597 [Cymbomonas tetramitiformis]|uniref:Uncharacterized protein n=1 Tax=Cymbomonas tetramitiformis TaxID=36881 RepID=A0AAE0C8U5_9CHLO|nr:hypothetical protein CYMTET_40597 [Cymbomonas tetramitiformis]
MAISLEEIQDDYDLSVQVRLRDTRRRTTVFEFQNSGTLQDWKQLGDAQIGNFQEYLSQSLTAEEGEEANGEPSICRLPRVVLTPSQILNANSIFARAWTQLSEDRYVELPLEVASWQKGRFALSCKPYVSTRVQRSILEDPPQFPHNSTVQDLLPTLQGTLNRVGNRARDHYEGTLLHSLLQDGTVRGMVRMRFRVFDWQSPSSRRSKDEVWRHVSRGQSFITKHQYMQAADLLGPSNRNASDDRIQTSTGVSTEFDTHARRISSPTLHHASHLRLPGHFAAIGVRGGASLRVPRRWTANIEREALHAAPCAPGAFGQAYIRADVAAGCRIEAGLTMCSRSSLARYASAEFGPIRLQHRSDSGSNCTLNFNLSPGEIPLFNIPLGGAFRWWWNH